MHPKEILARYGLEPKKSLGQNFLFDDNVLARIVAAADLTAGDQVLEIGPGLGSLTKQLAQTAGRVVAIEVDDRLLPILQAELAPYQNVTLAQGDILTIDPADWFSQTYKVVANVPYYITGAILRHLLEARRKPSLLALTVQKEVAERITAEPPHMSLLAVSVQFYGQTEVVATLKAGAFWPRPEVDSAVVRIDLSSRTRPNAGGAVESGWPEVEDEAAFFRLVKAGFSQKRKQLKNNLRALGYKPGEIEAALAKAGVNGRRRAETLSLAEWVAVYQAF